MQAWLKPQGLGLGARWHGRGGQVALLAVDVAGDHLSPGKTNAAKSTFRFGSAVSNPRWLLPWLLARKGLAVVRV